MARIGPCLAVTALLAGLALPAVRADAAVRICKKQLASDVIAAPTELEGKKRALDHWKAKAQVFGEPFASWRLAADRLLACVPKDGGFECLAKGSPCTIEQAPDKRELREKRIEM